MFQTESSEDKDKIKIKVFRVKQETYVILLTECQPTKTNEFKSSRTLITIEN